VEEVCSGETREIERERDDVKRRALEREDDRDSLISDPPKFATLRPRHSTWLRGSLWGTTGSTSKFNPTTGW
jgi:hypothetical protein